MRRGVITTNEDKGLNESLTPANNQSLVVTVPFDRHPAAVYLAKLSPGSRRSMRQALNVVAGMLTDGQDNAQSFKWAALRYQHTQAIRAKLAEKYAPASANKILAAMRGALREAWRLGEMDSETYNRAVDLEPIRGERLPHGRALSSGELRTLFNHCAADGGALGIRDAALLAILYGGGLRRAEVVTLNLADWNEAESSLKVIGKGNKARLVYLSDSASEALKAWLDIRGGSNPNEPLFLPINKSSKITIRRLTDQAIFKALATRATRANVAGFTPHDLRRSFISDLLDAGADIVTVQKLVGHSQPKTTARYDRRGEQVKKKAAAMLHVPFVK